MSSVDRGRRCPMPEVENATKKEEDYKKKAKEHANACAHKAQQTGNGDMPTNMVNKTKHLQNHVQMFARATGCNKHRKQKTANPRTPTRTSSQQTGNGDVPKNTVNNRKLFTVFICTTVPAHVQNLQLVETHNRIDLRNTETCATPTRKRQHADNNVIAP